MLNFETTDRADLEARMAGRLADYSRDLLAADASGVDCDDTATRLLDLAMGRMELRAATDAERPRLLIGYLLRTHNLNQVAVPVLAAVPYTLSLPGGDGNSGPVYWQNVLNKPALVTPAQLATAIANIATPADITVSLAGGKTAGTLKNNDFIPAGTKLWPLFTRMLVEDVFPTYAPAVLGLTQSAPTYGEVGESVSNTLTGTFTRNDAGALTGLRIQRDSTDLTLNGGSTVPASSSTSPSTRTDTIVRTLAGVNYRAVAGYAAGARKPVAPAGTADPRTALVRQANAPQAAETGFTTGNVFLGGQYLLFFGPASATPTNRTQALALGGQQLTGASNSGILVTGTTLTRFVILLPPGKTLTGVTDLDNLNANLLTAYVAQSAISLANAGGVLVAGYTPYVLTATTPYATSTRHQFFFA